MAGNFPNLMRRCGITSRKLNKLKVDELKDPHQHTLYLYFQKAKAKQAKEKQKKRWMSRTKDLQQE